ncbi:MULTISPECIES: ABC transporter permease [Rhodopseudomonas]|uniref:ABC transporter permease n=1 Tax=Rhodopseudomonas palustris TaxID=1076 RepID=A0A0D7EM76_RHOPL|nr:MULTISPECIES: ABC transporter permease [Rhodopseudomonas]KIZ41893.1 ABC transporter permease [Rhodopseudomonas palustris]MDF3812725.1 ABC transporter permease [Rhodopseudomonas sp. BAL398]WOK15787.1 ABC transporter permease [Rhodopseudomonas sp. BAL398]
MANAEIVDLMPEPTARSTPAKASRPPISAPAPWYARGRILLLQILLIGGILLAWEVAIRTELIKVYLYGQPTGIWRELVKGLVSGSLLRDSWVTAKESIIGFLIGSILGSTAGLLLWLSPTAAQVMRPLMVALNGLPKIALAPLIVVWFGVGIESKIAVAAIITFIVAMITSYAGTKEIDTDYLRMLKALGASRFQMFRMVIMPGSLPWIASAFRLNIGFAMIGAVVGEYISADQGLGYQIYYAGTLYNLNAVWVGILALMILALLLDGLVGWVERRLKWR